MEKEATQVELGREEAASKSAWPRNRVREGGKGGRRAEEENRGGNTASLAEVAPERG